MLLRWKAATDDDGMYGYQVFRGEEIASATTGSSGALLAHHASVRALSARYEDARVVPGATLSLRGEAVRPRGQPRTDERDRAVVRCPTRIAAARAAGRRPALFPTFCGTYGAVYDPHSR